LPSIGRTFDVIDSAGVLVALADPAAGWRILLSILRPRGVMRIGLYSELARQSVVAGRKLIAERGLGGSAKDIRDFRHEVMRMPPDRPVREVLNCGDFFSLSSCRDLLFHVQEHRFSLPQISRFLKENDLVFLGFDINPETLRRYLERFPADEAATDLDRWDRFEQENPQAFIQMYQFWVQRRETN
jgi:SAM-dependent methyltransferase